MKTLSIKNPWAWLIASGYKDVENRTWKTNFRGTFLIHVSQKWALGNSGTFSFLNQQQHESLPVFAQSRMHTQTGMPTSAIIGQVNLVNCVQNSQSIWAEPEHWHWVLENPVFFTRHVPDVKGKLSFWEFDESKIAANEVA